MLATLAKLKQVCNHPAQFLDDNSADRRPLRQAGAADRDARRSARRRATAPWSSRQFAEMGEMLKKHLQETFGREVLFLHGGDDQEAARPDGRAVSGGRTRRPRRLHPVAQGGRHRAQPDGGEPRVPFRPLVEPGRGEPGDRPRLPDRPDAATCRCTSSSAPARWKRRSTR